MWRNETIFSLVLVDEEDSSRELWHVMGNMWFSFEKRELEILYWMLLFHNLTFPFTREREREDLMWQAQHFLYRKVLDSNNGFEHFTGSENLVERFCCCWLFFGDGLSCGLREILAFFSVWAIVRERELGKQICMVELCFCICFHGLERHLCFMRLCLACEFWLYCFMT